MLTKNLERVFQVQEGIQSNRASLSLDAKVAAEGAVLRDTDCCPGAATPD